MIRDVFTSQIHINAIGFILKQTEFEKNNNDSK
jgi:hypothetical protein